MSNRVRRAVAPLTFLVLLVAVAVPNARRSQDPDQVDLRVEEVGGSVSVLYGQGGNLAFSSGPDGLLLVDSQFAWLAPKIEAELRSRAKAGPAFLVNTHFHGDHTGGNAVLGAGAVIVAHANTRHRLEDGLGGRGQRVDPAPPEALPRITFEDGLSIHFNGEEVRLLHLPHSHTDTDVAVWFTGSKVIHMGDTFFAGAFPFIDLASGGDVDGLIESVQRVLGMLPPGTRIVPGHGEVGGMEELGDYLQMLLECRKRVREALAAGKTAEEMKELELLGDYAPEWGAGFIDQDAFIDTLVQSESPK